MTGAEYITFIMLASAIVIGVPFLGIIILFIINAKLKNNGNNNNKDQK